MYVSKVYEMAVDSYGDVRTLVRGLSYQCPDDWEKVLDSLDEESNLDGLTPLFSINLPLYGETSYRVIFYTSYCNMDYIEKQKENRSFRLLENSYAQSPNV